MPVCAAARRSARRAPISRAAAAMAETQGEQVKIKIKKATADAGVKAAVRSP